MSNLGNVRIGSKAPDFHCEAVIGRKMTEVSLSTYIHPKSSSLTKDTPAPWLILLFIPAAFSFICPTEVLAFQNCYEEFRDRNCSVAFVSVDTKHSLWHWQNAPQQYGGLGHVDIPLLSDVSHKIGRDYGVLIEEEGVCLRGMFIIDGEGVVQQMTINNLTVGRSVLEALRLLEAFQAVAKHGVLCPVDWKPAPDASPTANTIPRQLEDSYEQRLENIKKEFGEVPVTDLDVKYSLHKSESMDSSRSLEHRGKQGDPSGDSVSSSGSSWRTTEEQEPPKSAIDLPKSRSQSFTPAKSRLSMQEMPDTESTTTPTPLSPQLPAVLHSESDPVHTSQGTAPISIPLQIFTQPTLSSLPTHLTEPDPISSRTSPSHRRSRSTSAIFRPHLVRQGTHISRQGFPVVLEFADPIINSAGAPINPLFRAISHDDLILSSDCSSGGGGAGGEGGSGSGSGNGSGGGETRSRWQAAFQAVRKVSEALASPRSEVSMRRTESGETILSPGFFDSCG